MIIVDTSAIMAILLNELQAKDCQGVIGSADHIAMSAGTLAELLIVSAGRGVSAFAEQVISGAAVEIVAIDAKAVIKIADAYAKWGKGNHPARLNMGDCFAYALAKERDCPLLYIGNDFSQTDIESVL